MNEHPLRPLLSRWPLMRLWNSYLIIQSSVISCHCMLGTLQWRHNDDNDDVSNHQPYHCLLNRLFGRRSKKTSKLRVTGLCAGNSPGTGEFPAQMASNTENASIWWRHHDPGWNLRLPSETSNNFRWLDSLWTRDAIWPYISGSIMIQVMLDGCRYQAFTCTNVDLIINEARWHSAEGNSTENIADINHHKMLAMPYVKTWCRHQMETLSALLAICAGNSPVPGEFPAQRPVMLSLMFSLICVWINGWVNNREAGDLRRYRSHYDVTVMYCYISHGPGMRHYLERRQRNGYQELVSLKNFPSKFTFDGTCILLSSKV